MTIGNEQNMDQVKKLMEQAQQVNLGDKLKEGVLIDFKTADGNVYRGVIVFKRPNMTDYMKMGAMKSEILRTAGVRDVNLVDATIKYMAQVIATLKVLVKKAPEWLLDIDAIEEPELLYYVYGKYEEWEESFRKPKTEPTSDSETSRSKETV